MCMFSSVVGTLESWVTSLLSTGVGGNRSKGKHAVKGVCLGFAISVLLMLSRILAISALLVVVKSFYSCFHA